MITEMEANDESINKFVISNLELPSQKQKKKEIQSISRTVGNESSG